MICRYGMLFQLYPLPNLNPHHPQFITKSYGASCLYAHTQATEAQLTLQRPKAIHVYGNMSVEEPVKAKKKCTISSIYLLFANINKKDFN